MRPFAVAGALTAPRIVTNPKHGSKPADIDAV
jgi:hypothetical protein